MTHSGPRETAGTEVRGHEVLPFARYTHAVAKRNETQPRNFEDALSELERILADIESGQMGLEESLVKYERGNFLIQFCRTVLSAAEQHIEKLSKAPDGGLQGETAPSGAESDAGESNS